MKIGPRDGFSGGGGFGGQGPLAPAPKSAPAIPETQEMQEFYVNPWRRSKVVYLCMAVVLLYAICATLSISVATSTHTRSLNHTGTGGPNSNGFNKAFFCNNVALPVIYISQNV